MISFTTPLLSVQSRRQQPDGLRSHSTPTHRGAPTYEGRTHPRDRGGQVSEHLLHAWTTVSFFVSAIMEHLSSQLFLHFFSSVILKINKLHVYCLKNWKFCIANFGLALMNIRMTSSLDGAKDAPYLHLCTLLTYHDVLEQRSAPHVCAAWLWCGRHLSVPRVRDDGQPQGWGRAAPGHWRPENLQCESEELKTIFRLSCLY